MLDVIVSLCKPFCRKLGEGTIGSRDGLGQGPNVQAKWACVWLARCREEAEEEMDPDNKEPEKMRECCWILSCVVMGNHLVPDLGN